MIQLYFLRRSSEPVFEIGERAVDLARLGAGRTRHPVERAQFVEDRSPDARHSIGFEFHSTVGVEVLEGFYQSDDACVYEVR